MISTKQKGEAKTKATAKVKKANLLASKRGMTMKMDANTIKRTIQKEAEKLAKKMVASATGKKGGNAAGGRGRNKSVKIQFKPADLQRGTDRNTVKQLQGMLKKSPKSKGKNGGNAGRGNGGNGSGRKIILR